MPPAWYTYQYMKETFSHIEKTVVKEVEGITKSIEKTAVQYRKSVLQRFPFLIIGLSTFGVVAVLYAFEQIIESIPFLADNPLIILSVGILALTITGTLYKKLS